MTVYKNIYFVPSFLYIPQIFWYSVWFLISERTRDYCLISFYLAYSLLTTVHTRFCLYSFAHIHMYQKSAFFVQTLRALSCRGGEYFPAMGTTCWRLDEQHNWKQTKHLWTSLKSYKCNNLCVCLCVDAPLFSVARNFSATIAVRRQFHTKSICQNTKTVNFAEKNNKLIWILPKKLRI